MVVLVMMDVSSSTEVSREAWSGCVFRSRIEMVTGDIQILDRRIGNYNWFIFKRKL